MLYLEVLNNQLNNLYSSCLISNEEENREIEEKIIRVKKKVIMAKVLNEEYIIAVAGLQGVGKTTLMKKFYDIGDEFLLDSLNIGERIPVIIGVGEENKTYVKKIVRTNQGTSIESEEIPVDEFCKRSNEPKALDICLELIVKEKEGMLSSKKFMLLPGINQARDEWDELVSYSLDLAATTILVFNETKMASGENNKFIKKVLEEFDGAKPLIALTESDLKEDGNLGLKLQAIERFKIDSSETDRIICTGADDSTKEKWVNDLKNSLQKYSVVTRCAREKELEQINSLCYEISVLLNEIKVMVNQNVDRCEEVRSAEKILEIVKKEKEKVIEKYEEHLEKEFNEIGNRAISNFEKIIVDEKFSKKLRKGFTGNSLKKKREFEETIYKVWEEAQTFDIENRVVSEMLTEEFPLYLPIQNPNLIEENKKQIDSKKCFNEEHLINLNVLLNGNDAVQIKGDFKKTVKYLPLLGMELIRVDNKARKIIKRENLDIENLESNKEGFRNFAEKIECSHKTRATIVKGIGIVLGVDAIDGNLDSVGAILKALGLTGTMAYAPMIGFGAIGGTVLAVNLISNLNKYDLKTAEHGTVILNSVKANYINQYSIKFRKSMDLVCELIEERVNERFGCNDKFNDSYKIEFARNDLNKTIRNIRKEIAYEVTKF